MFNYNFKLHNTRGIVGTYQNVRIQHGMFFADDGFGEFVRTDVFQVVDFFLNDEASYNGTGTH